MSIKRKLVNFKGDKARYDAGDMLRKLGDSICSGSMSLNLEDGTPVELNLPGTVGVELKVKDKQKEGVLKGAIEIEIKWIEGEQPAE